MPVRRFTTGPPERRRRWPAFVIRLLEVGTRPYPPKIRRRLKTLNAMAYLIAVLSTIYAVIYALDDLDTYVWIVVVNVALAVVGLCVPFAHGIHELAGGLLILVCEPAALFALVAVLGRDSGIQLNLVVGAAAPFVILGFARPAYVGFVIVLCFVLHLAAWFLFPPGKAALSVSAELLGQLYVSSA